MRPDPMADHAGRAICASLLGMFDAQLLKPQTESSVPFRLEGRSGVVFSGVVFLRGVTSEWQAAQRVSLAVAEASRDRYGARASGAARTWSETQRHG